MFTPWGKAQSIHRMAPGITEVSTASHGGIMLDAAHEARIPAAIEAGYSGSRAAWEEDCDWAVPFLLFESELAYWASVKGADLAAIRNAARDTLAHYRPDWLAAIDAAIA